MGNNNNNVWKFNKKIFQPCNAFKIKTVCWFVKNKNVWITKNCLCKKNPNFLTFIKLTHHFVMKFFFKTKTGKHLFNLVLCFVSTDFAKFSLHFCGLHSIFIRKIFFGINCINIFFQLIQFWKSHFDCFLNTVGIKLKVILTKNSHTFTRSYKNITCVMFFFATKNFKEC